MCFSSTHRLETPPEMEGIFLPTKYLFFSSCMIIYRFGIIRHNSIRNTQIMQVTNLLANHKKRSFAIEFAIPFSAFFAGFFRNPTAGHPFWNVKFPWIDGLQNDARRQRLRSFQCERGGWSIAWQGWVQPWRTTKLVGGNSQIFWNFHPRNLGKMNPFWRAYFSNGVGLTTK